MDAVNCTNATCAPVYDDYIVLETNITEKEQAETSWDDATWILTSSFIIFTMQSGFGLLESGTVSRKNEVNIMVKNAVDVIFGGLSYWLFGYGFIYGDGPWSNPFCGFGHFATDASGDDEMGWTYARFVFQASFATTATTIVSGAMAERAKLDSYCLFSFLNTFVYCFPAHWVWATNGFLYKLGAVDIAGAGVVHLVGGVTGLVATIMMKPRKKRFTGRGPPDMNNPTNALLGMFMLWWGWLGFNCGSTFGISDGKWMLAARAAVTTITASVGGGLIGILLSYITLNKRFDIGYLINSVLGGLVGSTALCAIAKPWECFIIGMGGGLLAVYTGHILEKMEIDDPISVVGVHGTASVWSLLSVGLFGRPDNVDEFNVRSGLFYGGGFTLLGVQLLMTAIIIVWTVVIAFTFLYILNITIGLRCSEEKEILGADFIEHGIHSNLTDFHVQMTKEELEEFKIKYLSKEDPWVPPILQAIFDTVPVKRDRLRKQSASVVGLQNGSQDIASAVQPHQSYANEGFENADLPDIYV
ncbi:putative ammonium transporter 3 [Antedon mediterranea]|uniref:putative ammonium transporter 3 n=1 Tax=Antedon mediterranea TaxID=105859 RepID=UPI003AF5F873